MEVITLTMTPVQQLKTLLATLVFDMSKCQLDKSSIQLLFHCLWACVPHCNGTGINNLGTTAVTNKLQRFKMLSIHF